ncbi:MAG: hypothetical protein ACRC7S_06685 [Cetobacterium sp.]
MKLIDIQTGLDTKGIITVEFGKALIVSFAKVINYQTVEKAGDITGATASDEIYKTVEAFFSGQRRQASVSVVGKLCTTAEDVKEFLDEVLAAHQNFFFVLGVEYDAIKSKALCEWGASNNLKSVVLSPTSTVIDTLVTWATGLNNSAVLVDGDNYEHARMVGYSSTFLPGYLPWSWRELEGVQATSRPLADQVKMKDANINFINEERRGLLITYPGKTLAGQFIKVDWGKANLEDDLHIALATLLKSNDPPPHPGTDESGATTIESALLKVIEIYASPTRKFIANWSEREAQTVDGVIPKTPKAWLICDTDYTVNDIALGKINVRWAAMVRGEITEAKVEGLITFNEDTILGGGQ